MEYKIIRSKRKAVGIEINAEGEVIVRAPNRISQKEIERIVEKNTAWIEKAKVRQQNRKDNKVELTDTDIIKLKKLAGEYLPARTAYFAKLMGAEYGTVKITSAKTRFGSCSSQNNICFSFRVMLYPSEAIDYVVVHELAHTFEHNHSAKFYAVIEKYLPDYKSREKLLSGEQKMPF